MPSVARVTYIPLKALAVNVIALYARSRRKLRKSDSMTTVDPLVAPLYSLDELTDLRRTMLRYARSFPSGSQRNQHLQVGSPCAGFSGTRNGCEITFGMTPDRAFAPRVRLKTPVSQPPGRGAAR